MYLEIRHLSVVAPVALATPAQRLPLGTADLAGLGVHVALELGRGAAVDTALSDVRHGGFVLGGGRGEGRRLGSGALQALKLGLLGGGELRGRRGRGEGSGGGETKEGGRGGAREDGSGEAEHCGWCVEGELFESDRRERGSQVAWMFVG